MRRTLRSNGWECFPASAKARRFLGDVVITQSDIVEQKTFDDAVSFGGWAIDLHPRMVSLAPSLVVRSGIPRCLSNSLSRNV